jgi:hypothetical protein
MIIDWIRVTSITALLVILGGVWVLKADQSDLVALRKEVQVEKCSSSIGRIHSIQDRYPEKRPPPAEQRLIRALEEQMRRMGC